MTTAVTLFNDGAGLPAHLADLNEQSNIELREQVPQLSFRGKVWRVVMDGTDKVVNNSEGDPVQAVQVVILDYNKKRGRAFYPGGFEEGKSVAPACWSKDGEVPDPSIKEPQAQSCASCKQSQKGSKVTDAGKAVTACSQYKRMAVVPITDTKFTPLLVKIPQTSMWDKDNKENENKGFYAFDQYLEMLQARGIKHTAAVVTKIKFDSRTAYPKLLFGAHTWLPESEAANIKAQVDKKVELAALLNVLDTTAPVDGPVAEPLGPPLSNVHEMNPPAGKPPARPVGRPPASAKPTPAPVSVAKPLADPDDAPATFGGPAKAPAPATTPPPAPAVATDSTPAAAAKGLDSLMAAWDD
jgi:hypothetical protein